MTAGPHESRDDEAWVGTARDRRRPGRPESVSAELVPLLRNMVQPNIQAEAELAGVTFGNPDQTRAITGVAVSLVLSAMLWAGAVAAVRALF